MSRPRLNDIIIDASADPERAASLSEELNIPVDDAIGTPSGARFVLRYDDGGALGLVDRKDPNAGPICVRFGGVPIRHGRVEVSPKQPLGRAFGRDVESIIDATAGLGHDAFLLACMGFRVTAVERHAVVAALLRDGLERALADGRLRNAIEGRLAIVHVDAIEYLRSVDEGSRPDAVYVDPMFPIKRRRSALAKKGIRIVRDLVGDDPDSIDLFAAAISAARRRVVVKRADDAPPLAPNMVGAVTGNLVRYDIYAPGAVGDTSLNIPRDGGRGD